MSGLRVTPGAPWLILTGEFPPDCGGVGDYTAQLAASLAEAGDQVRVFRPPTRGQAVTANAVEVVPLGDHYGPVSRREIARHLDRSRARVLVQYVPQTFGMRGANVPFCRWLRHRFRRGDDIRIMFHEPFFYMTRFPRQAALAALQRAMAAILLRAARRVYVSTEAWVPYLQPYAPRGFAAETLAIPSAIPNVSRPGSVHAARTRFLSHGASTLLGHFGTYGDHIAPLVADAIASVLQRDPSIAALCIGDRSRDFVAHLARRMPALEARLHATGRLPADETSICLQACDVLVQPYRDGVTTRRTSMMAGLANARPVVTTDGALTENIWRQSRAAVLVAAGDGAALASAIRNLIADHAERASLGARALALYRAEFAIERTVAALRESPALVPSLV